MINDCCSWVCGFFGSGSTTEEPASQKISERSPIIQQEERQGVAASQPQRQGKSILQYRITSGNSTGKLSHIETPEGKVCQLVRMTGYTFGNISSYPTRSANVRILEDLLFSGMKGQGLPNVAAVFEDREKFINRSISPKDFRGEVGETVFYYLQLLLYLDARGAPDIRNLAPYPYVKNTLVKYWDCLFIPMSVAAEAKERCEVILGKCNELEFNNKDGGNRIQEEGRKLNQLAVDLKELVLSANVRKTESDCSNNQRLINVLLDILTLYSGGKPDRVVKSLPQETINFLDEKTGFRTFASESCSPEQSNELNG